MKKNKKATSIVEAMVLMMVVVSGITGMYKVYNSSIRLEQSVQNKIIASNIAREGIEAMTNIRNTNWILFGSETSNCWNTLKYKSSCVTNYDKAFDIEDGVTYKIFKNNQNRWDLETGNSGSYDDSDFRNEHRIGLDADGFYTSSGILTGSGIVDDLIPLFTRKIIVNYPGNDSNEQKMEVSSIVERRDNTSTQNKKIELKKTLTNWKE